VIYIFRKEMRKWHTVLWVVLASLAISSGSFFFFRARHISEMTVAHVNGMPVYFNEYRRSLAEIQERINSLRPLARMYGMSEELFLSTFLGATKPEELAFDMCVKERLMDGVKDGFNLTLDDAWFKKELIKAFPQLTDEQGKINMELYQRYLERISTTAPEYEKNKREEFKRAMVQRFVQGTSYVPDFVVQDMYNSDFVEKSFAIASVPLDSFISNVKKEGATDKELDQYYLTNKDSYVVGEKRKAKYWEMSATEYAKKVEPDPSIVRHFYEKHKSTLYRVPPKVKVRHLLVKATTENAKDKATDLHKQLVQNPDKFAALAKHHSQDVKTAATGGLVDFFNKGTYSEEFERAAFRLKTDGEISNIVKTKDGFEILQLVQRIQAAEKPFESVKDEIVKVLRAKRSLAALRGELENIMRSSHEDNKAIEEFIQKNGLNEKESGWISEEGTKAAGLEGSLAKRLFSAHRRQKNVGYFVNDEVYVIYQLSGAQKSYTPTLEQIKDKVTADYYDDKAETLAKNTLKDARAALLAKKMTLDQFASQNGGRVTTTAKVSRKNAAKSLEGVDEALKDKMFALTDPVQVLEHRHNNTFYLAQVRDMNESKEADLQQEAAEIIKQQKYKAKSLHNMAFIASLYRNATIVSDKKLMEMQRVDTKDE